MTRRRSVLCSPAKWLAAALLVAACGSNDETASPAEPGGEAPQNGAGGGSSQAGDGIVQLAIDGETSPLDGGARLEVRELNPVVNLVVTAVYASNHDNLVQLQLALDGVENTLGAHRSDLGGISSRAFAVAYLERVSYTSQSGTLDVTLGSKGELSGSFEATLAEDPGPSGSTFDLSGSFQGSWSLVCRSPVIGLPGDHSVSDSPYCNNLEF